jgi:sec-independent protein translocase protein TatA
MFTQFGLLDFGAPELLIILAIIALLFGGKKLPELSRGVGESMRELKKASSGANDLHKEIKSQVNEVKSSIVGSPTATQASTEPSAAAEA